MVNNSETFDQTLLQSVEGSLKRILGEMGGETLLQQMEKRHLLKRQDIASRPEEFTRALETMLGREGASIVQNFIMREFYLRLGLTYEYKGNPSSLADRISEARNRLSVSRSQ
jgi:hypothetical protein